MANTNFSERIYENSIWNTNTPSPVALKLPIYGLEAGHFYAESVYKVTRNFHDSFLLLYSVKGTGEIYSNDTLIDLPEKTAIIIDCHYPHEYSAKGNDWEFMWLHFSGASARDMYELIYSDEYAISRIADPNEFMKIFNSVINEFHYQNTLSLMRACEYIQHLLRRITGNLENSASPQSEETINTALEYIHLHYHETVSVDDISSYVNLSKYHFIRIFKRSTGMTPYAYITNYRITQAKRMLVESKETIESIAHRCGFQDTANFIAKFKQYTLLSPLKYRNSFFIK